MTGEQPRDVAAFANAPGSVTITWQHSGEGINGFVLEQEDPFAFTQADRDKRAWTIVGLAADTTYRYRVCAVHDTQRNCSDENGGHWVSVTTLPNQAGPPIGVIAPTDLRVGEFSDYGATLVWNNRDAYDKILVRWRNKTAGPTTQIELVGGTETTRIGRLTPNLAYTIAVKGGNSGVFGTAYSPWTTTDWLAELDTRSLRTYLAFRRLAFNEGVRAEMAGTTSIRGWLSSP